MYKRSYRSNGPRLNVDKRLGTDSLPARAFFVGVASKGGHPGLELMWRSGS